MRIGTRIEELFSPSAYDHWILSLKQATTPARCLRTGGDPSQPSQSQAKSYGSSHWFVRKNRYGETRESRIEASFYKMNTWEEQALMTLSEEDRMLATKYEAAGAWVSYFLLPLSWWNREGGLGLCLNRAWTIPDCHSWSALKVFNGRDLAPVLLMNLYKTSEVFMKFPNCIIRVIIRNNLESWTIKRSLAFTIGLWPDFWNFAFNGHILLNSSVTTTTISQFYSSSMLA